jgi:putative addiction module component (TIGR02574 family)
MRIAAAHERIINMSTALELVHEIEKLTPPERVRVIDMVIRDMVHPDAEIESIWAEEATHRWNAYKKGEIETIPYETVMSRYRGKS